MSKPTHDLVMIHDEGRGRSTFTRVAAIWPTKDGEGFTGQIAPGVSVSGRFLIQPRKADQYTDEAGE